MFVVIFYSQFPYLKITVLSISAGIKVHWLDNFSVVLNVYGIIMVLIICKILSKWLFDLYDIVRTVSLYFR
jgi:hypothetical protein